MGKNMISSRFLFILFRRILKMAHLDLFIREIITGAVAAKTPHQAEIDELTRTIDAESEAIRSDYSRIGELYVEQASGEQNDTELGKLVAGVKASQKKIKESKLKIGELMGKNFCESCCEEVDDDALYCNNCGAKMPVKLMPGMVLCPHCNKAVREGIRFCTNCGGSMVEEPKPISAAEDSRAAKRRRLPRKRSRSLPIRYARTAAGRSMTSRPCSATSAAEDWWRNPSSRTRSDITSCPL